MTREEIEAGMTPAGGFTRATLAEWGVPWPPPKGWRKVLEARKDPPATHVQAGGKRRFLTALQQAEVAFIAGGIMRGEVDLASLVEELVAARALLLEIGEKAKSF